MNVLERLHAEFREALEARRAAGLFREPVAVSGVDLVSNDYLGYASDPVLARAVGDAIARVGIGSGASRLLGGHDPLMDAVEARLAAFSGRQASLLFPSGYQANVGWVSALTGPDDVIISDADNHASLIDGIRLSRARCEVVPHADLDAVGRILRRGCQGRMFVLVESLYSMGGDFYPLEALCELAEQHGAYVVVDEAHSTGLYGERGSGQVEASGLSERVMATIHTGGKALGGAGAWFAGDSATIDTLVNHCRSFIYSTAPAPALPLTLDVVLDRLERDGEEVLSLHRKATAFRTKLQGAGLELGQSASQIVPIHCGHASAALTMAARLQERGFAVLAVRPPTVPVGTSRLRITVRAPVSSHTLGQCAEAIIDTRAMEP